MYKIVFPLIFVFLFSCTSKSPKMVSMEEDVNFLASDSLNGRETGTNGELMAADYLVKRMKAIGLKPMGNAGTYFQTFSFTPPKDPHQDVTFTKKGSLTGTNVIGYLDHKAANTIVIGAHYDHLGMGSQGSLHRGEKAIHNGADDNASGIAVMLKLAEKLKIENTNNNYLFIAFSGEEMGLLGSNYFTKNPTIPIENMNFMLNLDMVGRLRPEKTLAVSGTGTSPIWKQVLHASNTEFKLVLSESGIGPSDHTSFYLQDIPVLHFFTGQHEDYHKPSDDAEKLNYQGMESMVTYLFAIIGELNDDPKLAFRKTKNESEEVPRFKVALGVIPDYLFDGKGMRIDGISEDKIAQKAGLQKGDIVIQLGDSTVVDMMSYMRALSSYDTGDATEVTVKRDSTEIKVNITF